MLNREDLLLEAGEALVPMDDQPSGVEEMMILASMATECPEFQAEFQLEHKRVKRASLRTSIASAMPYIHTMDDLDSSDVPVMHENDHAMYENGPEMYENDPAMGDGAGKSHLSSMLKSGGAARNDNPEQMILARLPCTLQSICSGMGRGRVAMLFYTALELTGRGLVMPVQNQPYSAIFLEKQ